MIIVQYINNTVSFSFKRKDLIDEYFNENEMTKRMNGIVEDLVKQHKLGNKEEAEEALVTLYEAFNDEVENYIRANVDPSLYNISDFDVRQFAFNLKNILESMGVNKEDVKYRKENRNSGKFKSYQDDMFTTIKQVERNNDER